MKTGFAKKETMKEDITRNKDRKPKGLLTGLAITGVLLAGVAAVAIKVKEKMSN